MKTPEHIPNYSLEDVLVMNDDTLKDIYKIYSVEDTGLISKLTGLEGEGKISRNERVILFVIALSAKRIAVKVHDVLDRLINSSPGVNPNSLEGELGEVGFESEKLKEYILGVLKQIKV